MIPDSNDILLKVERYYSEKLRIHGPVPAGVDWNSEASQIRRFDQLLKVVDPSDLDFSLLDYGCGYGSLYAHMKTRFPNFEYGGYDISDPMIETAGRLLSDESIKLYRSLSAVPRHDYVIASGIFNVKQESSVEEWTAYVVSTLRKISNLSMRGFAFNMLSTYSDMDKRKDSLFYADPCWIFDYCKRSISAEVSLLHDYGLYEFSVLVRVRS